MSELNTSLIGQEGVYRTGGGREYRYRVRGCEGDLDHPDSCLLHFDVEGPNGKFEKVIAIGPSELENAGLGHQPADVIHLAVSRLRMKLDEGNEADEPTPLA